MPAIILPGRSSTRPTGPTRLNLGSPQAVGLLHCFPLAGNARDYTGRANGVTVSGAPKLVSGSIIGPSYEQDAAGQLLTVTGDQLVQIDRISGGASLTAWVKLRAATPATGNTTGMVAHMQNSGSLNSHYPWTDGNAYINTMRAADDRISFVAGALVTLTEWHHVAVTWRATGDWRFYQNARIAGNAAGQALSTFDTLAIGGSSASYVVDGWLTDVRLYARELSQGEVFALYDPGSRWDLYRQPSRVLYFDLASGGFQSAWARGANAILQPGVR